MWSAPPHAATRAWRCQKENRSHCRQKQALVNASSGRRSRAFAMRVNERKRLVHDGFQFHMVSGHKGIKADNPLSCISYNATCRLFSTVYTSCAPSDNGQAIDIGGSRSQAHQTMSFGTDYSCTVLSNYARLTVACTQYGARRPSAGRRDGEGQ